MKILSLNGLVMFISTIFELMYCEWGDVLHYVHELTFQIELENNLHISLIFAKIINLMKNVIIFNI